MENWERSLGLAVRLLSIAFEDQGCLGRETEVSLVPERCLGGKGVERVNVS